MATTPLAVLDLVPISSGSSAAEALRNSIDLAQAAERLGYARYWFAEHHLNPGVAGTSPAVVLALTAAATTTIRIGSGAVQMGHRTALSTVEEFGLIDALHPGRLDLGLGRELALMALGELSILSERQLAGDEQKRSSAHRRNVVGDWRRGFRQNDAHFGEAFGGLTHAGRGSSAGPRSRADEALGGRTSPMSPFL